MRRFERPAAPEPLASEWRRWGRQFEESGVFRWPVREGTPLNQRLLGILSACHSYHCAFCDSSPIGERSEPTIEHLLPKARFQRIAFHWLNLFPACNQCQRASQRAWSAGTIAPRSVLRPDRRRYEFSRYFMAEVSNGEIKPNPAAGAYEQARARQLIAIYDLNAPERCRRRLRELRHLRLLSHSGEQPHIDDFSYRDFIEAFL